MRIKDTVLFRWEVIGEEELHRLTSTAEETAAALYPLSPRPEAWKTDLTALRKDYGPLANYLESIDRKLALILNLLSINQAKEAGLRKHHVDLSASGIAFDAKEPVPVNTCIRMWIVLLPSYKLLTIIGTVVRVDSLAPDTHRIAVRFDWKAEEDQDLLIEHIFYRQMLQLRARRKKMEDQGLVES